MNPTSTTPSNPESTIVYGYILGSSNKAIKFECYQLQGLSVCDERGTPRTEWFPLSQCTRWYKTKEINEMDWIEVPNWLLKKKEML